MNTLKENSDINQILEEYKLQEYWNSLTKELNDYVHNNGTFFSSHKYISLKA